MKHTKTLLILLVICMAFLSGFGLKSVLVAGKSASNNDFRKVTGIGGIFFKCKDPKAVREWYRIHLGLQVNQYGSVFEWYQGADSTKKGFLQWSPFGEKTKYFEPSTKDYMINYRVADMDVLVAELKKNGVNVLDSIQVFDYGKFVHILDIEGNKIELWEPNDVVYENMGKQMGAKTTK